MIWREVFVIGRRVGVAVVSRSRQYDMMQRTSAATGETIKKKCRGRKDHEPSHGRIICHWPCEGITLRKCVLKVCAPNPNYS